MKTCMRFLAVVFAVAMIVCALSTVSAAFPDVAKDNAYVDAIDTMTNLGIIGGYEDGTFRPDGLVRRDEMAKIIFVTFTTYTDAGEGVTTFPDVSAKSWAKGYISWCAGKNIVGGYEDGTFRPEGNITYDEALKMVCAMLGYTDFSSEMWPIDVRTKGLVELKLGKKLENIAGDTALTRAQIVQLVYNSLDKVMYKAPATEEEENALGILGLNNGEAELTLADDVWKFNEYTVQVIGTENYGFIEADKNISGTKTDKENLIQVSFQKYDDDGNFIEQTGTAKLDLTKIGMTSYVGSSDSLVAMIINLVSVGEADNYVGATLKSTTKQDFKGGYASTANISTITTASELSSAGRQPTHDEKTPFNANYDSGFYAHYAMRLDGLDYYGDDFYNVRRLTYFDDIVVATNANVDASGNANVGIDGKGRFYLNYSGSTDGRRENTNLGFSMTQGHTKYTFGIDKDADGYLDYVVMEFHELYKVKSIGAKSIEFEYLFKTNDTDYCQGGTNPITGADQDTIFPKENVENGSSLKEGDIVLGYPKGDYFTVLKMADVGIGKVIRYDFGGNKITLDNGTTYGGADFLTNKTWDSRRYASTPFSNMLNATSQNPLGAYLKVYSVDGSTVWTEVITKEQASQGDGATASGYDKAILLYVTEKTEAQVNEATKVYESFYPAYLSIDGRTILVNLNKNDAIDGHSGDAVSQNGSAYRAATNNDGTIQYANKLVTYTVDEDGYYTLMTGVADKVVDKKIVEKVIKVVPGVDTATIDINKQTGIVTITKNGVVENLGTGIVVEDSSLIYYEEKRPSTGDHKHLMFYLGSEIPNDFATATATSDIYLTYDEEQQLYVLGTVMIDKALDSATSTTNDPNTDARLHLFATSEKEAIIEGEDIYADYAFKNLFEYSDVTGYNKHQNFDNSLSVSKNEVYAWDATTKNYVAVSGFASYKEDKLTSVLANRDLFFTATAFASGAKVDESTKIVAITDKETAETKVITIDELLALLDIIKSYNDANTTTLKLPVSVGTYKVDGEVKIAYILVDWLEYEDYLFIAGQEYIAGQFPDYE